MKAALLVSPSVPMDRPLPVAVRIAQSRFGEMNEQVVVTLFEEYVLLVSEKQ
jgi:hypothetical protein